MSGGRGLGYVGSNPTPGDISKNSFFSSPFPLSFSFALLCSLYGVDTCKLSLLVYFLSRLFLKYVPALDLLFGITTLLLSLLSI